MRKFALGLILGIVLALLIVPQPAQTQEITCAWPCVCVCPTATPTATATPLPTATPTVTPTPDTSTVTVAHMTDFHAGTTSVNEWAISYTLADLAKNGASLMVNTGDCTNNSTFDQWALFRTWMSWSSVLVLHVPGNHDPVWPEWLGAKQWTHDVGAYRLIGFNAREPDLAWLASALDTDRQCVVFGHYPLDGFGRTDGYAPATVAAMIPMLQPPHTLAYVCGHLHWGSVVNVQGVLQIVTGRGSLGNVRFLTLSGGTLTLR